MSEEGPFTGLRADDTAIAQVLALLGPPARRGRRAAHRWAVLPTRSAPRYLIPVASRRVAAAIRLRTSRSRAGRVMGIVVAGVVHSGGARLYPFQARVGRGANGSLVELLRARFGRPGLEVAVVLGRPRVNRKPVLQIIDTDGSTVGFGKLGVDEHTDELVRREGRFLAAHGGANPPLLLPYALLTETWRDHELLVVSDLGAGIDGTGVLDLTAPMVEAIASLGPTERAPVLASPWWERIEKRVAELPSTTGALLRRCRDHAHDVLAPLNAEWPFGAWHGDLARWNAVQRDGSLVVWDWERSSGPVPVGFDAVHAHFHPPLLDDGRSGPESAALALSGTAPILADLGYGDDAPAVVTAYLLELRLRLAEDEITGALGDVQWYADAVADAALSWSPR
jgi:hypothetical protein